MAIDYFLDFRESLARSEIRDLLHGHGVVENALPPHLLCGAFCTVGVIERDDATAVLFRLDKFADHENAWHEFFGLVATLLERTSGDAVLSFEREKVLLVRNAGELRRGPSPDVWTDESWALAVDALRRHGFEFSGPPLECEPWD